MGFPERETGCTRSLIAIQGVHERFILNALRNANSVMGYEVFDLHAWNYVGEIDRKNTCHKLIYVSNRDTIVGNQSFKKGDRLLLGHNIKYPRSEALRIFSNAELIPLERWDNAAQDYSKCCMFVTLLILQSNHAKFGLKRPCSRYSLDRTSHIVLC